MAKDKKQELLDLISTLELLKDTSEEAAQVYNDVLEGAGGEFSGGFAEYLKEVLKDGKAVSALLLQLRTEIEDISKHSSNIRGGIAVTAGDRTRNTAGSTTRTQDTARKSEITQEIDAARSTLQSAMATSGASIDQGSFHDLVSRIEDLQDELAALTESLDDDLTTLADKVALGLQTVKSIRTSKPQSGNGARSLTKEELRQAADAYSLTTPEPVGRSKPADKITIKNNKPKVSQPASGAPIDKIISYLLESGFFDRSDDYSDSMQEIAKELQAAIVSYKDPAQKATKSTTAMQIRGFFKKITSASSTFSPTQVTDIQEDILKPVIEALKNVGADDEILQAGASRGASADAIKSAIQRVVSMLVTEQSGKAVRVGESVVDNDMLQILKPGALDRVIRNLGGIVRRSAVKTVVPRGETASLHLLNVMEDALGDTGALTVESKRDNDIPSSPDALSNTRVFPQFITRIGAYFNKFRQSMRSSLNPSLRYGPEAQGVDTRTGSQIVAGSSSAVFGGGMDVKVKEVVDRLLAQVGDDISKGAMGTARIAGVDVQLPQTLAKMVVEAIQTSSVLSEHTTAMGRMAGDKGPRGALETGDPIRKLLALFAGDLINQYRSTGGVSPDSAQNFMEQTVTPPQEHEVTLALTHALRLRERLTFQRDRADLDMVTAAPHMASAYRNDSIQYSKQIQLLDEILKVSEDPEEEKKLALRRGQIALPMNQESASLTRDQALTVLLRMPIGSVPAMPDAVAPIVQKAQQVSSGLRESGLTVPVRPSYGTSPIQSLVDFFSSGQSQSLERFQPIPLRTQLDEISAPTSGLEQKDLVAVISDAFGLSRQSGSQGNAITGIFYGARATDAEGKIKTGDDLDQSLGGGYRTKNGLRAIVQAAAEMQSYGSSGIPLIDYARLATTAGRTEEEDSMFEQVKSKLPHLGYIGEDQLKELAALDTSMDPQALIKRVMTLAAPAIQAHLKEFIRRQAQTAGMTSKQTEQLIDSGTSGENVPAGFESAFRVLQMFDPSNINSGDVTSEVNRAFSLFSTMLTDVVQPGESMPQLAARLLGRENRLESSSAPVAEALPDKNASFALLRAGGEVADTEAHRVTGSVYSRSVANQNNLTEALNEFEKLKAEIAELQSDISLKPEEADKITPIINQKIDQLQQVRQKLRLYYAAEPDPISMKFEALSTIVESSNASDTERANAVRDLALMQTIFKHTGRYVIDESQGFGSGTQEQRLAALLEHEEKVNTLENLKKQRAALTAGGASSSRDAAVEALIEKSDVDKEIAAVTKDISDRKAADVSAGVQTFVPDYNQGKAYVNADKTIGVFAAKNPDYAEDDPSQDTIALVNDLEAQTLTAAVSDGVSQSERSNIVSRLLSRAAATLPIDTPFTMQNIVDRANASPLSDIEKELQATYDETGLSEGQLRINHDLSGMSLKLVQAAIQRAKEKADKEKREATVRDYYEAVSQIQDEASMSDDEYLKYFNASSAFGSDLDSRRRNLKDKSRSSSNATLSAYRRRFNPDTGKYEHDVVRLGDSPIISPDLNLLPSDTVIAGQPSQTNTGPSGIVINNKPTNPLFEQSYETDQPVGIVLASDAFQSNASTDILSDPASLHRGMVNQDLLRRIEENPAEFSKKDDRSLIVIGSKAEGPSLTVPGISPMPITTIPETPIQVTTTSETIDEQIARVQGEIAALQSPATKLAREAAERGVTGQGEVAGQTYVHPDTSHGELSYMSRRSTLPLTADYPQQLSERFAKTGRVDISPETAGSDAAAVVNAAVAETLGLPIGPEVMPGVSEIIPDNVPDTSGSNPASAGAVPYFFIPGQSEPMVVVGQSTNSYKGRGAPSPVMGTVDPGQTQWQAAEREAQEELGVVFDPKADVPVTISPTTNDAFYMRRVQSVSPASAHFETQGVQILPLSVAIGQIDASRMSTQRDVAAGREALLALQAMVASGEITNDQEEMPISDEQTQKMIELTAELIQLQAKKKAAETEEDSQTIVDQEIAVAEEKIAALEQEVQRTEKLKTLQGIVIRSKNRQIEKQSMAGSADLKEYVQPEFKHNYNRGSEEKQKAVFKELVEEFSFEAPSEEYKAQLDSEIQQLDDLLKPEDDKKKAKIESLEPISLRASRGIMEGTQERISVVMDAFARLGVDMATGEVSADSPFAGIDPMSILGAAVSMVPEGDSWLPEDLAAVLNNAADDPNATQSLTERINLLAYTPDSEEQSEEAKKRDSLKLKREMLEDFAAADESNLPEFNSQAYLVQQARKTNQLRRAENDDVTARLQKISEIDKLAEEDIPILESLGISVSSADSNESATTAVLNAASTEIARMTLEDRSTSADRSILSVDELQELRNQELHKLPEEVIDATLGANKNALRETIGFESARRAQGMTGPAVTVPTLAGLLANKDQLLLDKNGQPILIYRGEDEDQVSARQGETPLAYENVQREGDPVAVIPSETPMAMGGGSRYGEGLYHTATRAGDENDPGQSQETALDIAHGYRGKGGNIKEVRSSVNVAALLSTASLLDADSESITKAQQRVDQRRIDLGLEPLPKSGAESTRGGVEYFMEELYREQVDPTARLQSDILNEADALLLPYGGGASQIDYGSKHFAAAPKRDLPEDVAARLQALHEEYVAAPRAEQLAVAMGYDAVRYTAEHNPMTPVHLNLFNPAATALVLDPVIPNTETYEGSQTLALQVEPTLREQTQVTATERRAQELRKQLEQQKQQLDALKARSEALKQEAAAASTPSVDVTAVTEESKRVADETAKVSVEIKASTEEIQQREIDLDAQIAEAEKAVQLSRQQIAALQQQAEGGTGGDEEVYFTVDNTGGSVTLEEKQILDRTSLRPSVRTRMTAPDTGESLFVSNTNVPALVRAAQTVDPTTVDSVLASMTDEEMRRTGMPAAKLPEEFNWDQPSTLPKEWQKESGEPLTDEERAKLPKTPAEYDATLAEESAKAKIEARRLYDKEDSLRQAVQEFYATSSPDVKDSLIQKHSGLQERIAQITEAERKVTVADERRSALWSGARAAAEKEATPEQLVSRLFRQSERAVQEYADEFTTVPEFTARDIVGQLVSSAIAQTSTEAPATSPAVASAVGETLTDIVEKGLPALEGTGGTMGTRKKKASPAATVAAVEQKYTAGQLKGARRTVRNLSGRADLTPEQRRRLSAARQKLHAHAIQKLTTDFGDNRGVMQIANIVAGLTPPDWAADPVQSARVSAISEAMSALSPFALKKLQDVDLTNSTDMDRLSKDEELRPIMEMLASQDIQQALSFKSGTQAYDTASSVIKAVETAKESLVEDSRGAGDTEEAKKLFFDLETTMGSKASERKIYQAASGSEGGDVEELFAVPVPSSAAAIQAVAADKTLTDEEKRKQIRELALKRIGGKPFVEGVDVNPKVIDRLVEHAMGGGTIHTQAGIKDILKGQIRQSSAVVGHNIADFDLPIVYNDAVPKYVQAKTEDTLMMSREAYPGAHSLSDTYQVVTGNPLVDAHDAAVDTRAVQEIYPSLATAEDRRKLRARYLASHGFAPDSTVAKLADIPQLDSITDAAERQKAFQQTAAAYTYYRPLAEMQDFTQNVRRSGGVTRIEGATDEQQATVFENMNKMFGNQIKMKFGADQTVETLDDKQLGEFIKYVNDEYIKPNEANAVGGDYGGMAQMLAGKMGGPLTLRGFSRADVADNFEKYATLEDRLAEGAMTGLSHDPTMTRATVGEVVADLSAGKPTTVSTTPSSSTKPAGTTTTGSTTAGGGVRPPGGGSGLTTAASPDGSGGGGGGFSSIGEATIDSLHAQNVAIEINGGTVNIHANFTDSAASKMTKSLVYISNKDGMNVNGDVTSIGGGGGGSYRRVSSEDRATLNVLEATKNEISGKLQTEDDPLIREGLRSSLNDASRQAIRAIVEPKTASLLDPGRVLPFARMTPDSKESLVLYNQAAQTAQQELMTQLAAQQAMPEGTAGRDDEIERLQKEIAAVEELIAALTELNAVEQRVGSASGTRNINNSYGTSSGSGTGGPGSRYPGRKSKEDEQVLLQLARNSFDQSAGSMGIAGGTTNDSRRFLTDLTRSTATTMIESSGIQGPGIATDVAALAATNPEVQSAYDEASKNIADFGGKVGGTITDVADDLFTVVSGLEKLKAALVPLATTSPEAAAALKVVQSAIDETSAAGKEQRSTAGVIETDNRKKASLVEEQMQAAASRPGLFAGGRRVREMREIQEGYIRDTFGQQGLDALMHRGRLRAYTATGKRVDMAQATVQQQRDTVARLQKQGINITDEDMTGIARMSGKVEQTKRSAPMGDKLFYVASKIRDTQSVVQAAVDTVTSIANIPQIAGGAIQAFAGSATGSNRIMTTARGLALNPENYQAALNAADAQRKRFGGSLTSNLGQVSSFIPLSNAYGVDISKTVQVARKLAAFDPAQGMEGASIAIKEFLSGNVASLSRRFEINRSALSQINSGDADKMLENLDSLLSSMGVTDRLIDEQANSMATKYDKMTGNLESLQISSTTAIVDFITPALESLIGEQSYFGKNVKERTLNTLAKEAITSYGDQALTDKDTGLSTVSLYGSNEAFAYTTDKVLEKANTRMMQQASKYNAATGGTTTVAPYRLIGNMKPEERYKVQQDALKYRLQGMNETQAIMQSLRNNQAADFNIGAETDLQRTSLNGAMTLSQMEKLNPEAYKKAVESKVSELNSLTTSLSEDLVKDSTFKGGGAGGGRGGIGRTRLQPSRTKANIVKQTDIDTYEVLPEGAKEGQTISVRIPNIDAFEKGTSRDLKGRAAAADLIGMDRAMVGKTYKGRSGPEITLAGQISNKDQYGRSVVNIITKEGKNLGVSLIAAGEAAVSFTDELTSVQRQKLETVAQLAAELNLGSMNKDAARVGMGGIPAISDEVRSQYFWDKYGMGLGGSAAGGAAAGYGAMAGYSALMGAGGALTAAGMATGLGVGALALGGLYAGGAYLADSADNSPEKMRELLKMETERRLKMSKGAEFLMIANAANAAARPGEILVGGVTEQYLQREADDGKRRTGGRGGIGATRQNYKSRDNYIQEGIIAARDVYMPLYEEEVKKSQEEYLAGDDYTKRVLARGVVNPFTNQQQTYSEFQSSFFAMQKLAENGDVRTAQFLRDKEDQTNAILGGTATLKDMKKPIEYAEKAGMTLDVQELSLAEAAPLEEEKKILEAKRDAALNLGLTGEASNITEQITGLNTQIEAITIDEAEYNAIALEARKIPISLENAAMYTASQLAFMNEAIVEAYTNPVDFKQEAKMFEQESMERNFQRRGQRVGSTLTAFARQAIMGLGMEKDEGQFGPNTGVRTKKDVTAEGRAVRMVDSSSLMPRNKVSGMDIVKQLNDAQLAAVREQQSIASTNRQIGLANAPEMQLLKSGFTNFAMYMNMAGATAEDLGRSFMTTMNLLSEGNPRYGLDLAQQMTGLSYETMIGMQLRPRTGVDAEGNPISSLNGANGMPYGYNAKPGEIISGPMVMPYTSGPRGTIAYSRDMMAVNSQGVRENALGIAPSQWQQFVSNATNANAELQRRAMSNAIQERDLNKNHLRNLEDITRNGMRQLESIHLNYTRNMFQLTQQADLVKNMNRANMQRSVATADISEADRTQINKNIWARDMRAQHYGQGRADLFLQSPDLATLMAIDPTLETDIAALQTASTAYDENADYYDPEATQALQDEKLTKTTPVLDKLKTAYANEKDPLKKAVIEKAIMTLSPDPNATVELQNSNVQETQYELGDAIARQQLGTQISDMEWQRSYRGLDIANNQQSMVEASKSQDPLALLNAGRNTDAMGRGFAQADRQLAAAQTNLNGLAATAPMMTKAYGQTFANIEQNGTTAFQNVLNGVDDFSISFQQQMEDALRNFDRQRLDMIQAFADAAVEIASIVPKEMIPIMQATSAFMNTQRQAELLWLSGRTDEANALAYQGMLKLGEVVYGEGKGKAYADKYSQNFEDMADVAARDVPQGDLGKFGVNTEDGWALRVKFTTAKEKKPEDKKPNPGDKPGGGNGPFENKGGGSPKPEDGG